jgi:hypothetical protein
MTPFYSEHLSEATLMKNLQALVFLGGIPNFVRTAGTYTRIIVLVCMLQFFQILLS